MKFADLGLSDELLNAVADTGYETPTPIQAQAIPQVLMGRDILGCAQTGTGKTASFTLPMIDILAEGRARARMPRSLILAPTRELAAQVADNFETYGKHHKLTMALLIGGTSMADQMKIIDRGVDVLIATPGRLLDLFERGSLILRDVKILVIDEADRMMDMGFIPDVEKIVSLLPQIRQTLFFSATMAPEIKKLADKFLMNPKEITVARPATTAETVRQGLLMVNCKPSDGKAKRDALRALIDSEKVKNAIVFCNRKRDVNIVCKSLNKHGYNAGQMHGDMVQSARMETLDKFKNDEITFLVCSDVAARGLDIPDLSHVFNFDLPSNSDDYVHRIGRTGRAGKEGTALSLSTPAEKKQLSAIVKLIGKKIPAVEIQLTKPKAEKSKEEKREPRPKRGRHNKRQDTRHVSDAVQVQEEPADGVIVGFGSFMPDFMTQAVELEEEAKPKKAPAKKKAAPKKKATTTRKKKVEAEPTAEGEEAPKPRKRGRPRKKPVEEVVVVEIEDDSAKAETEATPEA
ncbi:ATP-dependent RNA helicase RhlE [Candidatus Terasakiella magnetica]|uniref:DEAD-box ATP-dependent RNA helicase RhpA n=1 Tax=Candidatus Terasakiella magnetica TaxID=1867952 RepID=A0A1C3RC21_9PROT|nr:DEAD/DEAH box helicase [Candidatus Terasakiella magnetica]SCA54784.1 ATP-dependent RNA helicase RhlE [Candidatus Terasakiella magnetica]